MEQLKTTHSFPRFKTLQDWHDFWSKQQNLGQQSQITLQDLIDMRRKCYADIEKIRKRPLIVYATRFLGFSAPNAPISIDITDVDGFTDLINSIKDSQEIDVLLHSPGGSADATERIVYLLRNKFDKVHFLIPHSAYSAATMLALSGDSITLHPSATLGPIDPQINGNPAKSIRRGFENAREIIKKEGPEALPAYIPLIEKYSLELLEICEDFEKLSKELVTKWIREYMLDGKEKFENQIEKAVEFFSDYDTQLLHSRPLVLNKLDEFKLNIEKADQELSELLWESYILINGFFSLTPFVKLFENNYGISWGRQHIQLLMPQQMQIQHPNQ